MPKYLIVAKIRTVKEAGVIDLEDEIVAGEIRIGRKMREVEKEVIKRIVWKKVWEVVRGRKGEGWEILDIEIREEKGNEGETGDSASSSLNTCGGSGGENN